MKNILTIILALLLPFLITNPASSGDTVHFESGKIKTTLIELFTSQGCSSCPPADEWFNTLPDHPRLWRDFVPVAFHVDYWDKLGWKDPYSSRASSNRQFLYKQRGMSSSVYTPGFFINGREWTGWYNGQEIPQTEEIAGKLSATLKERKLIVKYSGNEKKLELHVALMGFGLVTKISEGENKGRILKSTFVVLSHEIHHDKNAFWQVELPKSDKFIPERKALALWVSRVDDPTPLQATGGWMQK